PGTLPESRRARRPRRQRPPRSAVAGRCAQLVLILVRLSGLYNQGDSSFGPSSLSVTSSVVTDNSATSGAAGSWRGLFLFANANRHRQEAHDLALALRATIIPLIALQSLTSVRRAAGALTRRVQFRVLFGTPSRMRKCGPGN